MTSFWEGVLAGYGIAIPVGAIAVLIVDMGLRRGFGLGFMAGAGAATADFFYASLAALAGQALASALAPFALGLRIASALVLLSLGGYGLWRARQVGARQGTEPTTGNDHSHLRTFGQFLGLTLLNPLNACRIVRVPVSTVATIPTMATAPMGKGLAMRPTTVATKIASRCQALLSTPSGEGRNQMVKATRKVMRSGNSLAPTRGR